MDKFNSNPSEPIYYKAEKDWVFDISVEREAAATKSDSGSGSGSGGGCGNGGGGERVTENIVAAGGGGKEGGIVKMEGKTYCFELTRDSWFAATSKQAAANGDQDNTPLVLEGGVSIRRTPSLEERERMEEMLMEDVDATEAMGVIAVPVEDEEEEDRDEPDEQPAVQRVLSEDVQELHPGKLVIRSFIS